MTLNEAVTGRMDEIVSWRHTLHANPELSGEEFETTAFVRAALERLGIEVLDAGLRTGAVGLLRGGRPGKTVALRADMDALPVSEDASHTLCSCVPGVMHACGHDVHTAALLGAAAALADMRETLGGDVLFLFQSAEEIGRGAREILNTGVLKRFQPAAVAAFHVMPELPAGKVGARSGTVMAAQALFTIRIHGKGGHAAVPQRTCDPVPAGAAVISALQTLASRRMSPIEPFVLSVCTVHAGTARNVIPDVMELGGTFRFTENERRAALNAQIAEIAAHTAAAFGCMAETSFSHELPALVNDAALLPVMRAAAERVYGAENVTQQDLQMIAEDFAFYAEEIPTFMFYVGCGAEGAPAAPLHSARFAADDGILQRAALLLAESACSALGL